MSLSHHTSPRARSSLPRHDWTREEVRDLFALPFPELIFRAAQLHRENFDPAEVQISTLLSIKTGGCPEDCAYCPQSAKFDTGVKAERLMDLDAVLAEARAVSPVCEHRRSLSTIKQSTIELSVISSYDRPAAATERP